jgi:oxygen-independent coproporphyrinogen-3 oxidase
MHRGDISKTGSSRTGSSKAGSSKTGSSKADKFARGNAGKNKSGELSAATAAQTVAQTIAPTMIVSTGTGLASQDPLKNPLFVSGLAFDSSISEDDYASALASEKNNRHDDLSVYIHLPFCPSRCLSCDHQTTVSHDHRQIDRYIDALEREIELVTDRLGSGRRLQQLHLGGGTPNYLSEVQLVRLVDIIDRNFTIDAATETSLEANAHRASYAQLSLLHGLGFRSLNLEVRDLDPGVQQALGRHQSLPVVTDVVESARHIGFNTVTTDLVYGLPMQSASSIQRTVEQLLSLNPDRIACYTYSRRPERFQHQRAIDNLQMPSIADKVAIFSRIVDGFCGAGYEWIGLDCFARSEDQIAQAHHKGALHRNTIGYTVQEGRSVLGFGSSSTSDLSTICVQNHNGIEQWRDSLERGALPVSAGARVSPALRARRHALSDLLCNLHLDDQQKALFGGAEMDPVLQALREDGLLDINGSQLTMTEAGRYTLHHLFGDASPVYRWRDVV